MKLYTFVRHVRISFNSCYRMDRITSNRALCYGIMPSIIGPLSNRGVLNLRQTSSGARSLIDLRRPDISRLVHLIGNDACNAPQGKEFSSIILCLSVSQQGMRVTRWIFLTLLTKAVYH